MSCLREIGHPGIAQRKRQNPLPSKGEDGAAALSRGGQHREREANRRFRAAQPSDSREAKREEEVGLLRAE
jgi:hypothetical protein